MWSILLQFLTYILRKICQVYTAKQQDHVKHNLLLDLPNEIVLTIASFLNREYQVLLSLSCQRLRTLLNTKLDLTFHHDRASKIRFLQLLELDHPRYLTCRLCTVLYPWRKRIYLDYNCRGRHTPEDYLASHGQIIRAGNGHFVSKYIMVGRGVVDLILRAAERGPEYCLPVSFLNMSGIDYRGISRTHEARLVDGQLILASRIKAEVVPGLEMEFIQDLTLRNICTHLFGTADGYLKICKTLKHFLASMEVDSATCEVFKCPFCETDHQLQMMKSKYGTKIILRVWRNYGKRHENSQSSEQIFWRDPTVRLEADTVSQRDVRAIFESKTGRTL